MSRLAHIFDCSWGLAALEAINKRGDASILLAQKHKIEDLGYSYHARVYDYIGSRLSDPAAFFWLDRPNVTKSQVYETLAENGVGIVPVVSDFEPVTACKQYNSNRRRATPEQFADRWQELSKQFGGSITFGEIDNEPLTGDAAYPEPEYLTRASTEARVLAGLGIAPISWYSADTPMKNFHQPISGPDDFPCPGWPAMTENWLKPEEGPHVYGDFVKAAMNGNVVKVLGLTMGAGSIPKKGLSWGGNTFKTTWMWNEDGETKTGKHVLRSLKRERKQLAG